MLKNWKMDHPIINRLLFYLVLCPLFLVASALFVRAGLSSILAATKNNHFEIQTSYYWYFLPIIILLAIMYVAKPIKERNTHGSSHFARKGELKKHQLLHLIPEILPAGTMMLPPEQFTHTPPESILELGKYGKNIIGLTEQQQEQHVLIVAPSGKRKTSGFFIPALMQEQGHRSLIINDIKDELYQLTAGAVARYHRVLLFSPTRPARSNKYNPLAHIHSSRDARDFARTWIENTGVSREAFWNEAATSLITAAVLHLIDTEQQPPLSRLADLLATKTLEELQAILLSTKSARAKKTIISFLETIESNPKVASGVKLGVANRLSILIDSEDYREVTATDEIDFDDFIKMPIALYINIPPGETEDLKPLTSVLISQLMNHFIRRAEEEGGALPRHIAFYLDEFANAGRLSGIERYLTLVRSAGIAFILAIQDFGQLDRVYGRDIRDTFLSGTNTQITLPGVGHREAEYFSSRLGVETILQKTTATSSKPQGFFGTGDITTTESYTEVKRPLMLPNEIREMPVGSFVMISDNKPPVKGRFLTYKDRKLLNDLSRLKTPGRITKITEIQPPAAASTPQKKEEAFQPETL